MGRRMLALLFSLVLMTGLCVAVSAAPPAALREESAVYNLDAAKLLALYDPAQSSKVQVSGEGVTLLPDASAGSYISLPVEMPEFTKISLTSGAQNTTIDLQPEIFVSVYRPAQDDWSDWTLLPDGENAGRQKGEAPTVLIRYRADLRRAAAGEPALLLENILVTGGESFFTESNLVTALIMVSALLIYLYRKKRYGAGAFRMRKKTQE